MRLSQREVSGKEVAELEISDTGSGIPARDLPHIFDRFYQSEKSAGTTGSGIGLNLVKQYVEMHQGTVAVVSREGEGTIFTVQLPMNLEVPHAEEPVAEEVMSEEHPLPAEVAAEQTAEDAERPTVMVVDDNDDFRNYLAGALSRHYRIVVASNGEECLRKIAAAEPTVVVCDVMMPLIDGFEVTRRIKSNIETSHIPIILLSARTSDDVRLEGYETGADAYVTKPFKMDLLEARIRNLIDERQRRISTFSQNADIAPTHLIVTTLDEKLMQRIMESIEKNMDNPDYSVEVLSSDVGMHRMNLYRKLQSLVGMPPSEFIRTMRLKRAA
ncbi:MAG: response regulator, partial [Alistipes sp.]|nr:response regulator [Alistipes sp.]